MMVMREDRAEFVRNYFNTRYQIPFYYSHSSQKRLTGYVVSKRTNKKIKAKINFL